MSLTWLLRSSAFLAYAVSASPLTGTVNQVIRISLPYNVSHLNSSSNASVTPSNTSSENALGIKCDGAQYGVNLNIADCKDAKAYISSGSEQFPWVERQTRFSKPHFGLPYRYMGGKYRCSCSP